MGTLSGLLGLGGLAASAYLPYEESGAQIDYLKDQIPSYVSQAKDITDRAVGEAQFTPFTVKTSTGGQTGVGAGGALTQQLGADEAALQQQMLANAGQFAGQQMPTASSLFGNMQAAQQGEADRARLALETRLAGQGRLGVGTAAYGGTPEALALEKALQEQTSQNYLTAQQMAPQLAGQNIANTQSALQAAYAPQTQNLAALGAASPFSQLATSAALSRAEQLSKGGQYGLEALATGNQSIAGLESARTQALANTLGGMFTASSATQDSPLSVILTELGIG